MTKQRKKLCPLWLSLFISLGVVIGLATTYQQEGEQAKILAQQPPSDLSVAYLEARLRMQPEAVESLNLLGEQYLKLHRWESALQVAAKLEQLGRNHPSIRQQAALLDLKAVEQMAYYYPPEDSRREKGMALYLDALESTLEHDWDIPQLQALAEKARHIGAEQLTARYYKRLSRVDTQQAAHWYDELVKISLAYQDYEEAAATYFTAANFSDNSAAKRHYLLNALQVLESGDQVDAACREAERYADYLTNDRDALVYLIQLARQAGRHDLVSRYAYDLTKYLPSHEQTPPTVNVAKTYAVDMSRAAEYDLVYRIFVEGGELEQAERIALKAFEERLEPVVWTRRLAMLNEWMNNPSHALKYWLQFSQLSDVKEAWQRVLSLAPVLNDDKAYLLAWQRLHAENTTLDNEEAHQALLTVYMDIGHWDSALAVTHKLKTMQSNAEQTDTDLLLLEAAITEQVAYQYPPSHLQRVLGMMQFTSVLHHHQRHGWDTDQALWLARKSIEAGDASLGSHYYFTAHHKVTALDEKREYFLSALKALVANNQLDQACDAAEQHKGELAKDPQTLRYLISLARQASRTDLMTQYARDLIESTSQSYRHPSLKLAAGAQTYYVSTAAESHRSEATDDNDNHELIYRAFIESGQLDEAIDTIHNALEQGLSEKVWLQRLAQASEWNDQASLALGYWWKYAKQFNDTHAWQRVETLAAQLNHDQAHLDALHYAVKQSPYRVSLYDQITQKYEMLGRAEAGMSYLKSAATGSLREPLLARYAELAERAGHDQIALDTYRDLHKMSPSTVSYAVHLAYLQYQQGHADEAFSVLAPLQDQADNSPDKVEYWRLYAELSYVLQDKKSIHLAYQHLLATEQASMSDFNDMRYFYESTPIDAARIAEKQYESHGSMASLQLALHAYADARAWSHMQSLLQSLSPEQQKQAERSAKVLVAKAHYFLYEKQGQKALDTLQQAIHREDANDDTHILYIWALVEFGSTEELRLLLHHWRDKVQSNSAYLGAFAAAELRLGNAARAVTYLRQQQQQSAGDPLWLLSLADAEEQAGHTEQAWQIRRHAWLVLHQHNQHNSELPLDNDNDNELRPYTPNELADLQRSYTGVAPLFTSAEAARSLVVALLDSDTVSAAEQAHTHSLLGDHAALHSIDDVLAQEKQRHTASKDVAMAWALSTEQHDLARNWLARMYLKQAARPAYAELAIALEDNDTETINQLLADPQRHLSIDGLVEALDKTGRTAEAETQAFAAVQGAPDNASRQETLSELVRRDRPVIGGGLTHTSTKPLSYVTSQFVVGTTLSNRLGMQLQGTQRKQRTTDSAQLAWVPSWDRELVLQVYNRTVDHDLSMSIGYRKGLRSFYSAKLQAKFNRAGTWQSRVAVGVNQPTTVTPIMQVGATKDMLLTSVEWAPLSRWFGYLRAEVSRYHAQNRTHLGRGLELSQEFGYRIRSDFPDWSLRVVSAQGRYSASNKTIPALAKLLPTGVSPTAAQMMPDRNFQQLGLMVGLGSSEANNYTRAWRPFMDAGYIHDSNHGWGPRIFVGLGGSAIGSDYLRIFFSHESAGKGHAQRNRQIGLSYRMAF